MLFRSPLEATVAWLDEGDPKLLSRQGVSGQLWLVRRFGGDRYELGVGYGPYFGLDHRAPVDGQDRSRVSGRLTMSMGYRFAAAWIARLSVNRIVTNYNRDTDVFLLGVGYLF